MPLDDRDSKKNNNVSSISTTTTATAAAKTTATHDSKNNKTDNNKFIQRHMSDRVKDDSHTFPVSETQVDLGQRGERVHDPETGPHQIASYCVI